jgi:hypothetical protein
MRTRLLCASTSSPAKKTKGSDDRNGSENFSEKYLALAKLIEAILAAIKFKASDTGGTVFRLTPARTSIAI